MSGLQTLTGFTLARGFIVATRAGKIWESASTAMPVHESRHESIFFFVSVTDCTQDILSTLFLLNTEIKRTSNQA